MAPRLTIYDIKRLTVETSPYFFSRATMRFFHQTLKGYTVNKQADGRYRIACAMRDNTGRYMGETVRFYNPVNRELEGA